MRSFVLVCVMTFLALGACKAKTPNTPQNTQAVPPANYEVPGEEAMGGLALDQATGEFFVASSSGKIYRGVAGATEQSALELVMDLQTSTGHLALTPDSARLVVVSGFGSAPVVRIVDLATKSLVQSIEVASSGAIPGLQDVAVSRDGKTAYVTNSLDNFIVAIDLTQNTVTQFALSSNFPRISNANQGFINATGIAVTKDGSALVVAHIIDKHLYKISLNPASLGEATPIDTAPYNISANGLWIDDDNELIQVAGDELRIYRFRLDDSASKAEFQSRYESDAFEQGLTYAALFGDTLIVLNGNGASLAAPAPGGDIPVELVNACQGLAEAAACSATLNGAAITGACSSLGGQVICLPAGAGVGQPAPSSGKYPVKVLQIER